MRNRVLSSLARLGLLVAAIAVGGCSLVVQQASSRLSRDLSAGVLGQDDLELVADGLPAYLLLLDGLIDGAPKDSALLLAGARLYGAYAGGFAAEPERRKRLAARAEDYARRAVCIERRALCEALAAPYDVFERALEDSRAGDVALLYGYAAARAGRLQADPGDWALLADLPRIEALLLKVRALEPGHDGGSASMLLGVLNCIRPESLGGRPGDGQRFFAEALERSGGRNQMARVLDAEFCARLTFDRQRHDRLLEEALAAEPRTPGLTLTNTLAQQRARELRDSADDFF
jgi:hypothetical protein